MVNLLSLRGENTHKNAQCDSYKQKHMFGLFKLTIEIREDGIVTTMFCIALVVTFVM